MAVIVIVLAVEAVIGVFVLANARRWPALPAVAGAVLFVWFLVLFQETGSFSWQAANMFNRTAGLIRFFRGVSMVFWLGVGVWGGIAALRGKSLAEVQKMFARLLDSVSSPSRASGERLTNQGVVALVEAGLGDELVIEKINCSNCAFGTEAPELADLKAKRVSEKVIAHMLRTQSLRGSEPAKASAYEPGI